MSSADPRRPEKVHSYKPTVAGVGGNSNEDLTPDYMNILGPDSTKGDSVKPSTTGKPEANTASNIIPTSPQYGVAIIPNSVITTAMSTNDVPIEVNTQPVDTITDSLPKTLDENKDVMHSTPSKNDRFKVVKIASSEPFRRGRWKCMDYVDQTPTVAAQVKVTTSQAQQIASGVYMQTQSLPPQQIQQLLLQGGFTTAPPQFYQNQMVPQTTQFFYQPTQLISGSVPAHFVTAGQSQQYFTTPVVPQNFQNVQFVQPYQSAFVPTTQQYQHQPTYTIAQTGTQSQPQPVMNGFTYTAPVSEAKPNVATSESQLSQSKPEPVVHSVDLNTKTKPTDVYANPQFVASAHSLPSVESETSAPASVSTPAPAATSAVVPVENTETVANPDDPGKTNPVVNAIDNKIEQAMDLVKSHLMYTVREEVEVLKEKIAELMERIQQLESENNYLRSQIPKNIPNATSNISEPPPPSSQAQ